jgi:hypothetical protein
METDAHLRDLPTAASLLDKLRIAPTTGLLLLDPLT